MIHLYVFLLFTREYVQRAFASVSNEMEKDRVEAVLKEKIEQAFNEGSAMTKDWSQEPLPLYVLLGLCMCLILFWGEGLCVISLMQNC